MFDMSEYVGVYRQEEPTADDAITYYPDSGGKDDSAHTFESISRAVQRRGHLKRQEFINIGEWKSERNSYLYESEDNTDALVREKTRFALRDDVDPATKIAELRALKGVGVPVASAILTVMCPEQYATIDYKALTALPFAPGQEAIREDFFAFADYADAILNYERKNEVYEYYLKRIAELEERTGLTPREIDMALWAYTERTLSERDES